MKLVLAIVSDEDSRKVTNELNSNGFRVTKLTSTGGFLKVGNTTLLVGIDDNKVNKVIEIIKKNTKSRKQAISTSSYSYGISHHSALEPAFDLDPGAGINDILNPFVVEVIVGGSTIFVLNVEKYIGPQL